MRGGNQDHRGPAKRVVFERKIRFSRADGRMYHHNTLTSPESAAPTHWVGSQPPRSHPGSQRGGGILRREARVCSRRRQGLPAGALWLPPEARGQAGRMQQARKGLDQCVSKAQRLTCRGLFTRSCSRAATDLAQSSDQSENDRFGTVGTVDFLHLCARTSVLAQTEEADPHYMCVAQYGGPQIGLKRRA